LAVFKMPPWVLFPWEMDPKSLTDNKIIKMIENTRKWFEKYTNLKA